MLVEAVRRRDNAFAQDVVEAHVGSLYTTMLLAIDV